MRVIFIRNTTKSTFCVCLTSQQSKLTNFAGALAEQHSKNTYTNSQSHVSNSSFTNSSGKVGITGFKSSFGHSSSKSNSEAKVNINADEKQDYQSYQASKKIVMINGKQMDSLIY